jgi:hypothetical protein
MISSCHRGGGGLQMMLEQYHADVFFRRVKPLLDLVAARSSHFRLLSPEIGSRVRLSDSQSG